MCIFQSQQVIKLRLRYDTIEEFNVDSNIKNNLANI